MSFQKTLRLIANDQSHPSRIRPSLHYRRYPAIDRASLARDPVFMGNVDCLQLERPMKHKLHSCNAERCFICDGGLGYCETCHGGEIDLPSDCPGYKMPEFDGKSI